MLPSNLYIFRHSGPAPLEPQSIDSLQYILNQKPLGPTLLVPNIVGGPTLRLVTPLPSGVVPGSAASQQLLHQQQQVAAAEAVEKVVAKAQMAAFRKVQQLNSNVRKASKVLGSLTQQSTTLLSPPVVKAEGSRRQAHAARAALLVALAAARHEQYVGSSSSSSARSRRGLVLGVGGAAAAAVGLGVVMLAPELAF
ncbi:hypothetical protein GGI21_002488 [Coemansia aciculifera]|nr:hypothetical protein GGI21_002488 [Coemansia aciculifera]